ncbi:hypothetical protein AB0I81_20355 [Nonomuraea sp. NPDC050404]|uniref:ATP-binding protein n=1 Tax=Nonomuraea sp. NPDC050404 TaxID=3155783 RepID=UPI003400E4F3
MDERMPHFSGEPSRLPASWMSGQPVGEEFPDLAPGVVMSSFGSRPVWGGMAWRRAFVGRGDQSAAARRMVGRVLADTGRKDDAEWVMAELISNVLRHSLSGRAGGFFVVEVLRGAQVARLVVYDLGGGSVPDFSQTPGSLSALAEQGRGLAGVAALALRFGVAGDVSSGHAVWVDLAFPGEVALAGTASDAAGAIGWEAQPDRSSSVMPVNFGEAAAGAGRVVAKVPAGCDRTAGDLPAGLMDTSSASSGPGAGARDGGDGRDSSGPRVRGLLEQEPARVSAFGQEPWARRALAGLRRDWPHWGFLVVEHRWLAIRGPQVMVSATGPEELRRALPPMSRKFGSAEPGSSPTGLRGPNTREPDPAAPTVPGLLGTRSDTGRAGPRTPPSPPSPPPLPPAASGADAGGVRGGDGAGPGLSGPTAAGAPPSGALATERSGTGTWAVVTADPVRVAWWLPGVPRWPWARARARGGSRATAEAFTHPAGAPGEGRGPRHRQVRSKSTAVATFVAA